MRRKHAVAGVGTILALITAGAAFAQKPTFIVGSTAFESFDDRTGVLGMSIPVVNPYFGQCALTADGSAIYVPSGMYKRPRPQISLVSTADGSVLKTFGIKGANIVRKMLLSPDETSLYAYVDGESVYRIDTETGAVAASTTLPNLIKDAALSPDGLTLYVSVVFNGVYALQASNLSQKWMVPQVLGQLAVSPDGKQVFVSLGQENFAVAIHTDTLRLTKLPLPTITSEEFYVALRRAGNVGLVFSEDATTYTVNFLNLETDAIEGTFIPTQSDGGYIPAYNRLDIPYPPIRFAPDGKSIWFLELCADSTGCVKNSMKLTGYSFPNGTIIGSTPLDQGFAFVAVPK